jgi:hypothetical protein
LEDPSRFWIVKPWPINLPFHAQKEDDVSVSVIIANDRWQFLIHVQNSSYHPELMDLSESLSKKKVKQKDRRKEMLSFLATVIEHLEDQLPSKSDHTKINRSALIQAMLKNAGPDDPLSTCSVIISTLTAATETWTALSHASLPELHERDVENASLDFDDIVGNLIPIRSEKVKRQIRV